MPSLLLLAGDGIGPEVMAETERVIEFFNRRGAGFELASVAELSPSISEVQNVRSLIDKTGKGVWCFGKPGAPVPLASRVVCFAFCEADFACPMRSNCSDAGSSFGSCATSLPRTARFKIACPSCLI